MSTACSSHQIVLAEDNPGDVGLVREALREHGIDCDLRVLGDGEEAVSFIDRLDQDMGLPCPDLLLLDLHLPRRDGMQVLRYLRASERCAQTPVVILTGSDTNVDRQNAEKHSALHYFQKPTSLGEYLELGVIIKAVISRPRSGQQGTVAS